MPKRALVEHRPYLVAAIGAALAFFLLRDSALGGVWLMAIKGAAVGALAGYALHRGRNLDTHLLAVALLFSALGDMGIELSLELGGALFALSHIVAIALYWRNRRSDPTPSQKGLAAVLLALVPIICWTLSLDWKVTLYGVFLGAMAASAWMSRFSRYRVGAGALLFVVSDWLIFAQFGPLAHEGVARWLVWPLYFTGQFLIATGVVQYFRTRDL